MIFSRNSLLKSILVCACSIALLACDPINSIHHPSFTAEGYLLDSIETFHQVPPSSIKFYVEASGSMNGFFRSNLSTKFKIDVWNVLIDMESYANDEIQVFDSPNEQTRALKLQHFREKMNTGGFNSTVSTKVPNMLQTMIDALDINKGETAVFISDMKYSPIGSKAMSVLLSQYTTDIQKIIRNNKMAMALIAATSEYLNKQGKVECEASPYYFLVIGKAEHVVWAKNHITALLHEQQRYVDAIEWGIDYKSPAFTLEKVKNGFHLDGQPTIWGIDKNFNDTCAFQISVDLSSYPRRMQKSEYLKKRIDIKSVAGSLVSIDSIIYDNKEDHISAKISVKVFDIFSKADVIEWNINIPDGREDSDLFDFYGAQSENELDKSFSIENFIEGCAKGKANLYSPEPNRILISTIKE